MKEKKPEPVIVHLSAESGITKTENLHVYVANENGKIIESTGFEDMRATLKSAISKIDGQSKIYIAQGLPHQLKAKANERMLLKAGAYEVVKNLSGGNLITIQRLPSSVLNPWFWDNCLITGHVNKDFFIDSKWSNLPLCNARVHICEVETEFVWPHIPIYYRRIPDWVIREISQKFVQVSKISEQVKQVLFPPKSLPGMGYERNNAKINMPMQAIGSRSSSPEALKLQSLPVLPKHIMDAVTSTAVDIVRQAIYDHHILLYPYLCLWPFYWPWIYTYDEETIVYTDCNGHFEMWENTLTEDGPLNIYIWIETLVNGVWTTVYKPPVPCFTKWNYSCGSDINITVTDQRVMPCDCDLELPGEIVWFRSIGESATALHIEQTNFNTVNIQGVAMRNVGCTDIIDSNRISPFGSTLNFKLLFGDGFPTSNITHYRWKKTRIKDENLNDILSPSSSVVTGQILKNYFVITQIAGQYHFETHSITLGSEGSGENIGYRIPYWDIYADPLVPAADKALTIQWTSPDFWSASLDSHSLQDGLYRFDLELLSVDASGNFQVTSVPKSVFQVSDYYNSGNSVNAPDYDLSIDSINLANALNLSFKVRIDNAPCTADIQNVSLTDGHGNIIYENGQPIQSGKCGFINYTDLSQALRISFIASQARNFATFNFNIIKGNNTEDTGVHASGYVISGTGGFNLTSGLFTQDVPVTQLLGSCPGQAALSENLGVYALATDGTNRLYYEYDAYSVNAFALSNSQ